MQLQKRVSLWYVPMKEMLIWVHIWQMYILLVWDWKNNSKREHLGVFLRLLTRSATGQPITTYSSHFRKPREGQEMHLVIVDNGRSEQLGREKFRNSLKCIRCGACFNTCPVYRRSGGHSYHTAVAGPIGSVLNPARNIAEYKDLPLHLHCVALVPMYARYRLICIISCMN